MGQAPKILDPPSTQNSTSFSEKLPPEPQKTLSSTSLFWKNVGLGGFPVARASVWRPVRYGWSEAIKLNHAANRWIVLRASEVWQHLTCRAGEQNGGSLTFWEPPFMLCCPKNWMTMIRKATANSRLAWWAAWKPLDNNAFVQIQLAVSVVACL